ncbi:MULTISPECIES: ATP-binding cassette domain-containing protein [unclassified Streptomyces]|uniref:ATP-binding cassette domain-containing protein n=1 Tax=unclassified Streptomyces TaxID=2593676 RepID=UPI00136ED12A|nr:MULTISPECIES: ATP-binding cassette domain-containing protein [unclassified Streptomyces]NEA03040.1 ATP-binding cassette domain-containing protein [Streptomyces sp. SID10116]MYY81310.1 ATP-binding cassette domain-containing protein [Streptomyces sp. SID335]MYZ13435.1 ATP-binding cassette domain-containing protein [Streptomyces sp. SID337]NDZ88633.1 ATP-binding cassette domain-containing protein [Streptomyces sp. SID10115]NEB48285.1 ATP-binding cassette domain-containing protein [Streptomyces
MRGIELRGARVHYGPLEALHGITLAAPAAALTVLLGRNGAGRTTALRALAGTVPLSSGAVVRDGRDITHRPAHERAAQGLCFVPDRAAVFPSLTVAENLALAHPTNNPARALDAYPELRPLLSRRAGTLSGGEQRMLAISRALLSDAGVILLDEPTLGMSPAVAARTYALLWGLDACVVLAEQRLPPGLREGAGRAAVVHELRRGAVAFSGEPKEFGGGPGEFSPARSPNAPE